MFNFDYITKEDIKEHNRNCPEIPDHLMMITTICSDDDTHCRY